MQFVVPQFIDVESKIIGPISARQFVILLLAAGIDFLSFRLLSLAVGIPIMTVVTTFACALAFGKVNTQPMHYFLLNLIQTLRRPRLRLWHRAEYTERILDKEIVSARVAHKPMISQSRLAEMSLLVDTGGIYGITAERDSLTPPLQDKEKRGDKMQGAKEIERLQLKELNFDRLKDPKLYGEK